MDATWLAMHQQSIALHGLKIPAGNAPAGIISRERLGARHYCF
jgi:hypothetical protein